MNIFEMLYPRFYFDKSKPIRLFEAFAGIGCQAMALKRITDNIELVGISEIDKPAIQSYTAIHGEVKNYGDITKMVSIPPCDIFTWSFPCSDLSKAGKQAGLSGGTRSGLVYEVLRLLQNTKIKPKVLIMENVIDLVQVKFVKAFNDIQRQLEELGYTNYNEVLNAKDYLIPQNRERVFMVSILGDKENEHYGFDFPIRKELKLRLKDLLEDEVDEKYYLSKKALKTLTAPNTGKYQRAKAFEFNIKKTIEQGIIGSIPAGDRSGALDPYYAEPKLVQIAQLDGFESSGGQREPKIAIKTWNDETKAYKTKEADMPRDRIYTDESNIGFTITTNSNQQPFIMQKYRNFYDKNGYIPNAFNPYNKAEIIDIVPTLTSQSGGTTSSASVLIKEPFIMQKSRGYNKGGKHKDCPPITANSYQENNFVAIPEATESGDDIGVVVADNLISKNKRLKTLVENTNFSEGETKNLDIYNQKVSDISQTLTQPNYNSQAIFHNLRIRKLTPLECWRLMGISDEDFYKAKASGVSNSQLYKQAGNGICINVFEAILREMIR